MAGSCGLLFAIGLSKRGKEIVRRDRLRSCVSEDPSVLFQAFSFSSFVEILSLPAGIKSHARSLYGAGWIMEDIPVVSFRVRRSPDS